MPKKVRVHLDLDAHALLEDPLFLKLEPEGRGILLSLWLVCVNRGGIPSDPRVAARYAGLDTEPVEAWWDQLRGWFMTHPTSGALTSPWVAAAIVARERRRLSSLKANANRHGKEKPPPPPAVTASLLSALVPAVSGLMEIIDKDAQPPVEPETSVRLLPKNGAYTAVNRLTGPKLLETLGDSNSETVPDLKLSLQPKKEPDFAPPGTLSPSLPLSPPTTPSIPVLGDVNLLSLDLESTNGAQAPAPAHVGSPVPTLEHVVKRTPRPRPPASDPLCAIILDPADLALFRRAEKMRSDAVEHMTPNARDVRGVARHDPAPAARKFQARILEGYTARALVACLWLHLESDGVSRGYLCSLKTFWGNPAKANSKAIWLGYLSIAQARLAAQDAKGGAPARPLVVPPVLPAGALAGLDLPPPVVS